MVIVFNSANRQDVEYWIDCILYFVRVDLFHGCVCVRFNASDLIPHLFLSIDDH